MHTYIQYILIQRQAWCLFMVFHVGSLNYAWSEAHFYCVFFPLFCPCRKRQHSFHAGSLWLSGLFTKLQVPGQPQVQRVFGQHQHRAQPCALSQLGAPDQQQQKRFNPQPVCLVMLRCPCPKTRPKPCSHNPPRPSTAPWEVMTPCLDFCTRESEVIMKLTLVYFPSPRLIRSSLTFSHSHFVLWIPSSTIMQHLSKLLSNLFQSIHLFP